VGNGLALHHDALDEQSPAVERETSVTVSHEDLRFCEDGYLHIARGVHASADVTNVQAEYS
jgi:hypothetical protein